MVIITYVLNKAIQIMSLLFGYDPKGHIVKLQLYQVGLLTYKHDINKIVFVVMYVIPCVILRVVFVTSCVLLKVGCITGCANIMIIPVTVFFGSRTVLTPEVVAFVL